MNILRLLAIASRNPSTRSAVAASLFVAAAQAATTPFQAILGTQVLGLNALEYSTLVVVASAVGLILTVSAGLITDRYAWRRLTLLICLVIAILSAALFMIFPTTLTFTVLVATGVPFINSAYSSLQGEIRRSAELSTSPRNASSIGVVARALVSAVWVVVPSLSGLAMGGGPESRVWFVAIVALIGALAVTPSIGGGNQRRTRSSTRERPERPQAPARGTVWESVRQVGALRILGVCLLIAPHRLGGIVLPLLMTSSLHGSPVEVGLASGLLAGLEVPAMLGLAFLLRSRSPSTLLLVGSGIYTSYLIALSFTSSVWQVYVLLPFGAIAAAAILAMPVTFMQDSFSGRSGLAVGVISMVSLGGNIAAMGAFALSDLVGIRTITAAAPLVFVAAGALLIGLGHRVKKKRFQLSEADTAQIPTLRK